MFACYKWNICFCFQENLLEDQSVQWKSMYKLHPLISPAPNLQILILAKKLETTNFKFCWSSISKHTGTNKYGFKTLTWWLWRAFIYTKFSDSETHTFSFKFAIKNLGCSLKAIIFKIITLKFSMKLKFKGDWKDTHGDIPRACHTLSSEFTVKHFL